MPYAPTVVPISIASGKFYPAECMGHKSRIDTRKEYCVMQAIRAGAIVAILPIVALAQTQPSDVTPPTAKGLHIERLATLEFPWGMALLPDGRLLVTEKPGRLRIFAGNALSQPVEGVPTVTYAGKEKEQGGFPTTARAPNSMRRSRRGHQ
jgi:glucose/arabinose dehydrogenase